LGIKQAQLKLAGIDFLDETAIWNQTILQAS
jgi:hypothetical protein